MNKIICYILTTIITMFILRIGLFIYSKIKDTFIKYIIGFLAGMLSAVIGFLSFCVYLKVGGTI